jgi:hypothetical protein
MFHFAGACQLARRRDSGWFETTETQGFGVLRTECKSAAIAVFELSENAQDGAPVGVDRLIGLAQSFELAPKSYGADKEVGVRHSLELLKREFFRRVVLGNRSVGGESHQNGTTDLCVPRARLRFQIWRANCERLAGGVARTIATAAGTVIASVWPFMLMTASTHCPRLFAPSVGGLYLLSAPTNSSALRRERA